MIRDNILYYQFHSVDPFEQVVLKLVVPKTLREEVLVLAHDIPSSGHLGIIKTLNNLRRHFMWYKMSFDVELFVKTCKKCSMNKKPRQKGKAELGVCHSGAPMGRVHIDILGPFPKSDKSNVYILMLVDQFTKWLECFPIPDQNATTIAKTVVEHFISKFGCPLQIHTDQGRNFEGNLFTQICQLLQITKTRTTPYHPSSNGQVER